MLPLSSRSSWVNISCEAALSNSFCFGGLSAVVAWEAGGIDYVAYSREPIVLLSLALIT
jgi:hypothetical protein